MRMTIKITTAIFIFLCVMAFKAFSSVVFMPCTSTWDDTIQPVSDNKADTGQVEKSNGALISDSPIASMLDSLVNIKYFRDYYFNTDTSFVNPYQFPFDTIPVYSDSVYNARIELLNRQTPLELIYNPEVREFINLYGVQKRQLTSRLLGLAEVYFPLFEEQLDRFNLPLELKYLAVVESALNASASSRAGARGLWQFMYGTGKLYGLKVTSYVDERYDPYLSTVAACKHLCDLHEIYNDWFLVLAAYNAGAGNVNKAIRRAGNIMSYWAIQPFLPRETRGYVPAFIAVYYIMTYAPEHNLYPLDPGILYNGIDTVTVHDVLSFGQVSEMLGVPNEDLHFLNPEYKLGVLPSVNNETYILRLPKEYVADFINNEKALYYYKTEKGIEHDKLLAQVKQIKEQKFHTVRTGENLGLIARKYHCGVTDLKRWNGLRSTMIYPGQRLLVYTPVMVTGTTLDSFKRDKQSSVAEDNASQEQVAQQTENMTTENNSDDPENDEQGYIYHVIKPGETLWDIANFYKGVTVEQIKKLNNITNVKRLRPGQKIKIAKTS
jgi:membrane-bound lytic murein transglycosylase D